MSMKNPVTRPGIDPGTVTLVAQHLNQYATPGLIFSWEIRDQISMNVIYSVAYDNKRRADSTKSNPQALIISEALVTRIRYGRRFIH
jgi:hypothetical protein